MKSLIFVLSLVPGCHLFTPLPPQPTITTCKKKIILRTSCQDLIMSGSAIDCTQCWSSDEVVNSCYDGDANVYCVSQASCGDDRCQISPIAKPILTSQPRIDQNGLLQSYAH